MGGGKYIPNEIRVIDLTTHVNYKHTDPVKGDSIIEYTLRCAAHLVSPPMEDDEDNEFKCTDIAVQILLLEEDIARKWKKKYT